MARKLFGTDGVRGVAGEELSAELALALGRSASSRAQGERPRVLVIRDTRESGEMLQCALAAGASEAGADTLLAGVLPTPAAPAADRPLRLRPGGRDLGLPQPLPRQRHQVLRRRRLQAQRRAGARDRGATWRAARPRAPRRARSTRAGCASCTAPARTTCASSTRAFRSSTWAGSTCCSTAPTAPPTGWRPRSSGGWGRR